MDVQHQNGYHHSSVGSPLPPSHTPSPGLTNGSPSASSVKSKDLRATNLKVVIPSTPSGGPGGPGGLLGISRNHEEVSELLSSRELTYLLYFVSLRSMLKDEVAIFKRTPAHGL